MLDMLEMIFEFFFTVPDTDEKKQASASVLRFIIFTILCFLFVFFCGEQLFSQYESLGEGTWFFVFLLVLFIGFWIVGSYQILRSCKRKNRFYQ